MKINITKNASLFNFFLNIVAIVEVGGWEAMQVKYMNAATNYTLNDTTFYQCGLPREDSFHIARDAVTGDIPWPGALLGLSTLGLYVWCQDQVRDLFNEIFFFFILCKLYNIKNNQQNYAFIELYVALW